MNRDHVTKLNIGKFSSLPQLTELKLRGVAGLAMPSYTLSGGLDDLSSLTQLKKLVSRLYWLVLITDKLLIWNKIANVWGKN